MIPHPGMSKSAKCAKSLLIYRHSNDSGNRNRGNRGVHIYSTFPLDQAFVLQQTDQAVDIPHYTRILFPPDHESYIYMQTTHSRPSYRIAQPAQ